MDVRRWLERSAESYDSYGLRGLYNSCYPPYHKLLRALPSPEGENVYDREWDVLVILDACRRDVLDEVTGEYEFLWDATSRGRLVSVNSQTLRWMEETFTAEYAAEMRRTAYVCGNPFSATALDAAAFGALDEVWADAWTDPGTVPPEAVTDRAVERHESGDFDRVIAHYMQPHAPFLDAPDLCGGKRLDTWSEEVDTVWARLRMGRVTRERVWDAYRQNVRRGLDAVETLCSAVDARVAITSDHGNAFGERAVYGHPRDLGLDCLRVVPWVEVAATRERPHEPSGEYEATEVDREEQLRMLGYQ